jgi:hypothetical protein
MREAFHPSASLPIWCAHTQLASGSIGGEHLNRKRMLEHRHDEKLGKKF